MRFSDFVPGPRMWATALAVLLLAAVPVRAQEPAPRIPFVVVDLHGNALSFPDDLQLAGSRGLNQTELPGFGLGADVGVHVYPFRWRAVTFGVGGQLTTLRARQVPDASVAFLRPATERFTSLSPQVSLNFGTGHGWSYLSGGMSQALWSIVPDDSVALPVDDETIKTINYGGGARWFIKPHVAFSLDVRFYAINPGSPGVLASSPRTTLVVIGAGVSLK